MSYFNIKYQYVDTRMITIGPFAEFLAFANNFIGPLEEETVLLALLVTCLRRGNIPWWVILILNSLMRGVFHLYQGWPALRAFIWPIFIVLLYRCTGALLGICLSHCVWDMVLSLYLGYYDVIGYYVMSFSLFVVFIYISVTVLKNGTLNNNE
ncbi:CPBP family glutamic-type intramembrane protease [Bifidobacterium vespertilionis]|uniref:CPBP family intramembrane metalloprotease n=1 Tax=Bifidobacterium vespertilionis TaxID=2562524 RepID=A0A5J5E5I4_9BIFI|nr:CPBP family intramembrane glutamic endopeptidase [Bifidobacterium vespertilionis]KAA8822500.1 CPBP family intramembrane metalloprotease [Bifidobacterium vespertilionis]KAA8824438.1 CPBP family intramembrane metalloprotease [Bifidobacterium vespertilionis]